VRLFLVMLGGHRRSWFGNAPNHCHADESSGAVRLASVLAESG
jgi:hypothetical protein